MSVGQDDCGRKGYEGNLVSTARLICVALLLSPSAFLEKR